MSSLQKQESCLLSHAFAASVLAFPTAIPASGARDSVKCVRNDSHSAGVQTNCVPVSCHRVGVLLFEDPLWGQLVELWTKYCATQRDSTSLLLIVIQSRSSKINIRDGYICRASKEREETTGLDCGFADDDGNESGMEERNVFGTKGKGKHEPSFMKEDHFCL